MHSIRYNYSPSMLASALFFWALETLVFPIFCVIKWLVFDFELGLTYEWPDLKSQWCDSTSIFVENSVGLWSQAGMDLYIVKSEVTSLVAVQWISVRVSIRVHLDWGLKVERLLLVIFIDHSEFLCFACGCKSIVHLHCGSNHVNFHI